MKLKENIDNEDKSKIKSHLEDNNIEIFLADKNILVTETGYYYSFYADNLEDKDFFKNYG